jgi:hypothetical protein
MILEPTSARVFYGWRVVAGAFVLAIFGWGVGFYGPPVFLHAVREAHGWSLPLVSAAVTTHFVIGAIVVANLPALYRRFGLPAVTRLGAIVLALGIFGWAAAAQPWQLFAATLLSGAGWVAMGAAAVNGIIAPWFVRTRPAALATAYNGASIGGVVFSPLWVAAIGLLGFPIAAALVGIVMTVTIWILASTLFARSPQQMGLQPDGDTPERPRVSVTSPHARPLPGLLLWRDWKFWTLALGMALGLFAQIGLIAQLFSLLVPALGEQKAGLAMGLATACAIGGRTVVGWIMPSGADRRLIACAGYAVQIAGSLLFIIAGGTSVPLLLLGVVLFGSGIGNATSLPPLIAQVEFAKDEVQRVISLIVAVAQATYAFAPAFFGALLASGSPQSPNATVFFAAVAVVQGLAIACVWAGRSRASG